MRSIQAATRALDGVGAGLAEGLAAGHVGVDHARRQAAKRTRDTLAPPARCAGPGQRHRRQHAVRAAGQRASMRRLGGIGRLAQDAPAQRHGGVGAQDRRGRQAAPPAGARAAAAWRA
jgi:hypothetical protein